MVVPKLFSMATQAVMAPVLYGQTWLVNSDNRLAAYVRSRGALLEERETLERELAALSGSKRTIDRLERENQELRALLGVATTTPRVAAEVLERPSVLVYDTVIINRGSRHGIEVGAPVYVGADTVIGRVSRVQNSLSLVTLLTSPEEQVTVFVVGPNIYATAIGQGGGVVEIQVPQGVDVASGQSVLIPRAPQSTFGTIDTVRSIPREAVQAAYASLPVPMQSLRWVTVGKVLPEQESFSQIDSQVQTQAEQIFSLSVPSQYLVETTTTTATSSVEQATSTDPSTRDSL